MEVRYSRNREARVVGRLSVLMNKLPRNLPGLGSEKQGSELCTDTSGNSR